MVINLLKIAVFVIIIALFSIGLILFIRKAKNETRKVTIQRLKEIKWFRASVIILALIITVCYVAVTYWGLSQTAGAIITLNYSEASLGQNANGTRFNMSEIVSKEVFERAIKKGGLEGVTANDLKKCFSVSPLYEGNAYSKDGYHISTEFEVFYKATNKTSNLDSNTMVYLLCNSYRDFYFDKYVNDFKLRVDNFESDIESLDYFDIVNYLQTESNSILNYLYGLQKKNSAFVSSKGSTFSSVASKVFNFNKTQIADNLRSFVLQNGLSKDKNKYEERLIYTNKQLSFEFDKQNASYKITNEAVTYYDKQMATIVLVPTWDNDGKYYMGRTKIGIDQLSVQSVAFSKAAASVEKEMKQNELVLENLKNSSGNTAENRAIADTVIKTIQDNITRFADEARQIGQEYYDNQMNQCVSANVYNNGITSYAKEIIFVFILAFIASAVFYIGRKYSYKINGGEE